MSNSIHCFPYYATPGVKHFGTALEKKKRHFLIMKFLLNSFKVPILLLFSFLKERILALQN